MVAMYTPAGRRPKEGWRQSQLEEETARHTSYECGRLGGLPKATLAPAMRCCSSQGRVRKQAAQVMHAGSTADNTRESTPTGGEGVEGDLVLLALGAHLLANLHTQCGIEARGESGWEPGWLVQKPGRQRLCRSLRRQMCRLQGGQLCRSLQQRGPPT